MNHWWRAYNEAVNDPKLQLLSDALFRAWFNLMCIASANGGLLPAMKDVAFTLRIKPERAAQILTQLHAAGLLDKTETGFEPHNWNGRQYKSDVSTDRVQRFRKRKRNVSVTPPETDTEAETERAEPNGSGAVAPRDYRTELFDRGLKSIAAMTGKGPDACRSFVGKCLKAASDDAVTVLGLIEDAERNRVVNPTAWIVARLKPGTGPPDRPLSPYQQQRAEMKEILNDLETYSGRGSDSSQANPSLLPGDSGERSEGVRSGPGANVIDLPAGGHRASG